MPIWERYFLKELLKTFFLIIFSFFALYILIDFASHSSSRHYPHALMQWMQLLSHYLGEFILRANVLFPFALLIAAIRTLLNLNTHYELVALLAAGIPLKKLMRPFLLTGLVFVLLLYLNTEFLLPQALKGALSTKSLVKNKNSKKFSVKSIALKDQTTLLFQNFDPIAKRFDDACWIRSFDEIWRFRYLYPYEKPPRGIQGERLIREGAILSLDLAFEEKQCPQMRFNTNDLLDNITPPEAMRLSQLWAKLPRKNSRLTEKEAELSATFYHKMALPWLCLAAILVPAPFCVRYNRLQSPFLIYAFSIFGLTAGYLLFEAAEVLGSRQVISSFWALGIPFLILINISIFNFFKLR